MTQPSSAGSSTDVSGSPYLSRPAPVVASLPAKADPSSIKCDTRLYIGNLHTTVDEHSLIQIFSKYGKLVKLDYLFHKTGPQRGQPRGYAFIEYGTAKEAERAVAAAHGQTIRGKRISVTFATLNTHTDEGSGPHRRRADAQSSRHTALSLSKKAHRPSSTNAKIAAMEAKLAKLRNKTTSHPSSSTKASLPPKPPAQ